jgi:hypothetical protein
VGYTLGQAAKAAGVSKTTIQRALRATGTKALSATRLEDGSYDIDPAELLRVFGGRRAGSGDGERVAPVTVSVLQPLRLEVDMLREQLAMLKDERDDLRQRLDRSEEERRQAQERVTALLTDQRPPAERRGWWRRLFGR